MTTKISIMMEGEDGVVDLAEYGMGQGATYYKGITPSGQYVELHVWNKGREDPEWCEDVERLLKEADS